MNELPDNEIGRMLASAVPPLREPEDRLGQIRARVRRSRLRAGAAATGGVAVAAALALVVPQLVTVDSPPTPTTTSAATPAECPTTLLAPTFEDAGGPLVRSGAVDATLCPVNRQDGPPRLLTTGVDDLVEALNSLEPLGPDGPVCVGIDGTYPGPSLVLRYPDGGSTVAYTDWRCSVTMVDGRTRTGNAVEAFRHLHRRQLTATIDPASIPTPTCPETIGVDGINPAPPDAGPADTIDRYGVPYPDDIVLPVPLVGVATCRYAASEGGARLAQVQQQRGDLAALRDAINETFGLRDSDWGAACASGIESLGTALPDVILVADAAGQTAEFWVFRTETGAPCAAAFAGPPAYHPSEDLVAYIERALGY